jgi:hypothetical protein
VPRWTRWVALAWAIAAIPTVVLPDSPLDLNTWPRIVTLAAQTGALGVGIWAQMYRYRRVDTRAQQVQTKWVAFGAAAAVVMAVCLNWAALPLLPTVQPGSSVTVVFLLVVAIITRVAFVVIPLSIGIAVVRHQLFDIDLIIRWTVVYGALTIALVLLYDGGSTVVEYMLLNLTGQGSVVAAVAASFVVGLLAHPLQRLIQNAVDRFLFRPHYVAERRIEAFSEKLRHEIDRDIAPEQLEQALDNALGQAWATVEQHLPALHQIQHVRQHDD